MICSICFDKIDGFKYYKICVCNCYICEECFNLYQNNNKNIHCINCRKLLFFSFKNITFEIDYSEVMNKLHLFIQKHGRNPKLLHLTFNDMSYHKVFYE